MRDFVDRVPTYANRKKITHSDGSSEIVTVEFADEPTEVGTPLNRSVFMALQGMEYSKVVFNSDGSITTTYPTGTLLTVFNSDGSITDTFTGASGLVAKQTTVFNADGSIETTPEN